METQGISAEDRRAGFEFVEKVGLEQIGGPGDFAAGVLSVHPDLEDEMPHVPGLELSNRRLDEDGMVAFDYRRELVLDSTR